MDLRKRTLLATFAPSMSATSNIGQRIDKLETVESPVVTSTSDTETATLTSLDYVRLIAWIAYYKQHVILNKTQMQKLLFMCYGQALVMADSPLFTDDTPKAWPFGPVFPRSYKRYEEQVPLDLSDEDKRVFATNPTILKMVARTVTKYCRISATRLSDWSHSANGPWFKTVFAEEGTAWNRKIPEELIKEYFNESNWSEGI